MRIIRDLPPCPPSCRDAVVALGNFDGMHLGHQAIIAHARAIAEEEKRPLAAMTFEPHPREFFSKSAEKLRIYRPRRKYELMRAAGVEFIYAIRFNEALSSTSAEAFISGVLHETLGVRHIVTGYNFFFGKGRTGDKELLARESKRLGFGYSAHAPVVDDAGQPVSSSRIRALLTQGDVASAAQQLGHAYQIAGHVRPGDQRGRQLGFPTANILPGKLFLPRLGVYAVRAKLPDGSTHHGVANLGVRPTFNITQPGLEVHLFDFSGDLYGKRLQVQLLDFIREEQRFSDISALKTQIAADTLRAEELCRKATL